jgi:hypothetical protein
MSSIKNTVGLILFAKSEASYLAGAAMSATDAIQVAMELPVFNTAYNYDGNRNGAQWSGGNLTRATPGGKSTTATIQMEGKGLGATYTTASTPPNLHPFLLASGLSGSVSASAWVYKPTPLGTAHKSLALTVYDRGECLPISGAYCAMKFGAETAGLTTFTFDLSGVPGTYTDVATPPSRTWTAHSVVPPKNTSVTFSIGAYATAKIRSYSYEHGIELTPRINLNESTGFAGYQLGRRNPTFSITVEADALATFDAYSAWEAATQYAVNLTVGSVANNRFTFSFPQAVLSNVERANDGPVALWNLTFTPAVSIPDSEDDVVLTWH